jgi:hypothetical protein
MRDTDGPDTDGPDYHKGCHYITTCGWVEM